jgi:membrane fusion protein (multidrug efflux system)
MKTRTRLALLLATALAAPAAARATAAAAGPARVKLVEGTPASGGRWVAASVVAARRATLATRMAASVRSVEVQEGQAVKAGDLLVSLADGDLRGQLAAAQAGLAAAAAHERRIAALAKERAATPSELEQAQAQRAQAEAAVSGVRENLRYTEIRAPFAGTVQARRVEPGDLVGPGQPLVTVEGSALELHASLSEGEARGLAVGAVVAFRAGEVSGKAEIVSLTPGGDPLSHRRGLRARVRNGEGLRSGAFARIEVPGAKEAGPSGRWVPRSALVERGDLSGVFVAASGKAELRWLALGEPVGDQVEVRAGLREGERVIDAPGALRDGQPIEVAP